MRAPPESFRPITGAPTFIAWSITLQIFSACASRQRAAEDGEVLAEDEHQAAVDHAVAGDHAVARDLVVGHAEVGAAVLDEHVPLFEGAVVEQQLDPLARGELALVVLRVDALLAAAQARRARACLRVVRGCRAWSFSSSMSILIAGQRRASALRADCAPQSRPAAVPSATSRVSCGSSVAHLRVLAEAPACRPASMRSHIHASACCWRRAVEPAVGAAAVAGTASTAAQKRPRPSPVQRAELHHLRCQTLVAGAIAAAVQPNRRSAE